MLNRLRSVFGRKEEKDLEDYQSLYQVPEEEARATLDPARAGRIWAPGEVLAELYSVQAAEPGRVGPVFTVRHLVWGQELTVRSPLLSFLEDPHRKAAHLEQMQKSAELGVHPNLVWVLYVRTLEDVPRVFSEKIPGQTLRQVLASRPDLPTALDLAIQLCNGLHYAHLKGVVHPDLCPETVQADGRSRLRLDHFLPARTWAVLLPQDIDPRLVRESRLDVLEGPVVGSPLYLAPEQWGRPAPSRASNVYSLGAMIYELVCGRPPILPAERYRACALASLKARVLTEGPADPARFRDGLPGELRELLLACLERDPSRRPQDLAEVSRLLREVFARLTGKTHPRLPLAPARYEADNLNNQALLALDRGAPGEQALEMLEQALARQPDHPQALVNQALLAWELGLVTTAAALEALPPGRHPARLWLLAQTGEPERALEELLAPGNAWSFNLRGVLLHQLDRPGQALTDFEGAVQLLPQQWQYQHNLGVALSRAGEKEKALVHLERAASLTSDPLPAVSYAVTLAGQGRAREARSALQKVHEQHPESAWLNYHLGALYAGMGLRVPGADGLKPLLRQAREHLLAAYRAAPTLHRVGEALRECNRRMEIQEDLPEAAPDARPHRRLGCLWTARLARVFSGHKEGVVGITMSWDGRYFISAGLDDTVRVWDPLKGEVIATLRGHAAGVRSLAISADGTLLLSGSDDSTARLWQLPKGPALHVLRGHQGEVWAVALSYDGGTALTGGTDRRVRVWDARSGDLRHALEGHRNSVTALAVSYDGLMAVSGSVDGTLRVWDLRGGVELGSLETPEEIYSLALSFDGRRVLTGGSESVLRLWDLESGQCLHELAGHENEIRCVSMSPDGRFALSGGWDRTVRLWDLGVGECIRVLRGHEHQVTAVYACPDNRFGFSGSLDKSIRMWEWKEELLPLLPGPPPLQWAGPERVEKLAMGEVLWADTLQRARAEMAAGRWKQACSLLRRAQTLPGRRQDPEILDLLEDCGRHGRRSGLRQGWCLGVLRGHSDWVRAVAVSADARRIASGSLDCTVRLWDGQSGQVVAVLEGHGREISGLALEGGRLLSASYDSTLRLWSLDSPQAMAVLRGPAAEYTGCALAPGRPAALSCSLDGVVRLWNLQSGALVRELSGHRGVVFAVAFTPDGRRALSAGRDKTVILWDLAGGRPLWTAREHTGPVLCLAVSADGTTALSGGDDGRLLWWNLEDGSVRGRIDAGEGSVHSVALSPDGRYALSGGEDGALRLWHLEEGRELACLAEHSAPVRSVCFAAEGRAVVSGGNDNTVRVWELDWEWSFE